MDFDFSPEEESCEEERDEFCEEDAAGCEISCNSIYMAVCADASVQLSVGQSSCAAIPPTIQHPMRKWMC